MSILNKMLQDLDKRGKRPGVVRATKEKAARQTAETAVVISAPKPEVFISKQIAVEANPKKNSETLTLEEMEPATTEAGHSLESRLSELEHSAQSQKLGRRIYLSVELIFLTFLVIAGYAYIQQNEFLEQKNQFENMFGQFAPSPATLQKLSQIRLGAQLEPKSAQPENIPEAAPVVITKATAVEKKPIVDVTKPAAGAEKPEAVVKAAPAIVKASTVEKKPVFIKQAVNAGQHESDIRLPLPKLPNLIDDTASNRPETGFKKKPADFRAVAYQKALGQAAKGYHDQARKQLTNLLFAAPGYLPAIETLAKLYIQDEMYSEALQSLNTGLQALPQNINLIVLKSTVLMKLNQEIAALGELEEQNPVLGSNIDYYALRAALYQKVERYQDAVTQYQKIINAQPRNAKWWLGLAISHEKLGQNQEALNAYVRAQDAGNLAAPSLRYIQSRIDFLLKKKTG